MKKFLTANWKGLSFLIAMSTIGTGCEYAGTPASLVPTKVTTLTETSATLTSGLEQVGTGGDDFADPFFVFCKSSEASESDPRVFEGEAEIPAIRVEATGSSEAGGSFTADISGLEPGVEYLVRAGIRVIRPVAQPDYYLLSPGALAFNTVGDSTNPISHAAVANPAYTSYTGTEATLGGEVLDDGGETVTERGFVYSLFANNPDPAIGGDGVTKAIASGIGIGKFSFNVVGLSPGTKYVFKAYSTVAGSTYYSSARTLPLDPVTIPETDPASIWGTAVQPDGKTLMFGDFGTIGGESRLNLARLNPDGTLDLGFAPNPNSSVYSVAVQPDGKILIGGGFTQINGESVTPCLARLNADGTIDETFLGVTEEGVVRTIAIQPDNKILVGGFLGSLNGHGRYGTIGRLNPDGSLDETFAPGPDVSNPFALTDYLVDEIVIRQDGKILIKGDFDSYQGTARLGMARLLPDGSLDTGFAPAGRTFEMAAQADGKTVVASFYNAPGYSNYGILRFLEDGTPDPTFAPHSNNIVIADTGVDMIAIQSDGKIILGGTFTTLAGTPRTKVARLNADGTLDSFQPGFGFPVQSVTIREDGGVLIGGNDFFGDSNVTREILRQFTTDTSADSFINTFGGSSVRWIRGGSAPEALQASFDHSNDGGMTWTSLGTPEKIEGGFELTGLSLPAGSLIRARARAYNEGGRGFSSSTSLVEKIESVSAYTDPNLAPPIVTDPTATVITATGANIGGNVANEGGSPVMERGVVYSNLHATPVIGGYGVLKIATVGTTGAFSILISDLSYGTEYNFRAYAKSAQGISYSPVATFRTIGLPLVRLKFPEFPTDNGAIVYFDVTSDAGSPVTDLGISYQSKETSTASLHPDNNTFLRVSAEPYIFGGFFAQLTGLAPDTEYIYAGFATNSNGTGYSDLATFRTTEGEEMLMSSANDKAEPERKALSGGSPGELDISFDAGLNYFDMVQALAIQPDSKILVAGSFIAAGGYPNQNIVRLHPDGSIDTTFNASVSNLVYSLAYQPDGRIAMGGAFTQVNGLTRSGIARLNPDGSTESSTTFNPGGGADSVVFCLAPQPDGKIILGGLFENIQGTARNYIARLNANGTLDPSFDPDAENAVFTVALQSDGKILIGGAFQNVGGSARNRIARLNPDGSIDGTFDPGADDYVTAFAVQPDGKILVAGSFTQIASQSAGRIARLNPDGSFDAAFDAGTGADGEIGTIALQADGKFLIGGQFLNVDGTPCPRIAKLNPDGSLDESFDPGSGADDEVTAIALLPEGGILVGGLFDEISGTAFNGLARYTNDSTSHEISIPTPKSLTWNRGPGSPQVISPLFEHSGDGGKKWTTLANAIPVGTDWTLPTGTLPISGTIRVSGTTIGGYLGGSTGRVTDTVSYDFSSTIAALRGGKVAAISEFAKAKKRFKKAKKKMKKKPIKKAKKALQDAQAKLDQTSAELSRYE